MSKTATIPENHHAHRCYECGTVWHHENSCQEASDEVRIRAHTCPKCGETQYFQYFGQAEFILPNLCGTSCAKPEALGVEDYMSTLEGAEITFEDIQKMTDDDLLHFIITGKIKHSR